MLGFMTTGTVIIGAGQAGLSLSRHLTRLGHNHVVLERGDVGERWRSERWDSLRLLTPNWLNTLEGSPGHADRDGYLASAEFVAYLERYAHSTGAPVQSNVDVVGVEQESRGFRVRTDAGDWHAANVVVATGFADIPHRPPSAVEAPRHLHQLDAARYRTPSAVPAGGVLVLGSGPSGQQIAAELRRAGRHVVLAAGRHGRLPRRYLGQDIWHWLNEIGDVNRVVDDSHDRAHLRRSPSLALTGANGGERLDLGVLDALGVVIAGHLARFDGGRALFADDLAKTVVDADERMRHVLDRIDSHVKASGRAQIEPDHLPAVRLPDGPRELDLAGVSTVIW